MIHLITGRPGHGKNIYALHWLEQQEFITYNQDSKKFSATIDRPLFFIAFDGIDIIDATIAKYSDLDDLPIEIGELNQSKFPDNSIVVIDEAHRYSPKSSNRDGFTNFVSFLKIHRHFGFDFVFITQSQKDLNIDIRNLVENHYRVNRPFGTNKSFVNHYLGAETTENKLPIKQSSNAFKIDKRFFDVYKSASIHNYKSSIPKKYWIYIALFLAFIIFVISKGYYAYQAFSSDETIFETPEISNNADQSTTVENVVVNNSETLRPYFYRLKHKAKFINNQEILKSISPNITITNSSIFCYCTESQIRIIDGIVNTLDKSKNIKIDFILVSFNKKDYLDFSLKYSFSSGHFSLNGGKDLISNLFLLDYLKEDYKALIQINSSAFVEAGRLFTANFVEKYPVILRDYSTSPIREDVDTKDNQDDFGLVSENINFNDVGFKFKILTDFINDNQIGITLKQSHSFLKGFVDDVPILDKRDFNSHFLLKNGQLVPLFNLSSFLNSKKTTERLPLISWLFPQSKDNNNSNYQIFLRFRFENQKPAQKTIKSDKIIRIKKSAKQALPVAPFDDINDAYMEDEYENKG